ncbi:DUF4405 domain-containing protein [bacterium]|nr:DUF4405 domain-containing protein [bacterium]
MKDQHKSGINKRSLNVLVMFFSCALLPPSGIILHLSDHAAASDLERQFVMSIHNFSAVLFLISAVIHMKTNWKTMMRYVSSETGMIFPCKKEAVIALIIVFGLVALFSSHVFHAG